MVSNESGNDAGNSTVLTFSGGHKEMSLQTKSKRSVARLDGRAEKRPPYLCEQRNLTSLASSKTGASGQTRSGTQSNKVFGHELMTRSRGTQQIVLSPQHRLQTERKSRRNARVRSVVQTCAPHGQHDWERPGNFIGGDFADTNCEPTLAA